MSENESKLGKPKVFTRDILDSELTRAATVLGRTPRATDMMAKNGFPSFANYQAEYGSFNAALEANGLTPNRKSPRPVPTEYVIQSKDGWPSKREAEMALADMNLNHDDFEIQKVFKDRSRRGRNGTVKPER